jgi:hypothetical protein
MRRARARSPVSPPGHVVRYGARILDAQRHDPYQPKGQYGAATRCRQCGAVYRHGRWQWSELTGSTSPDLCPACRRIRDKLPAGWLTMDGPLVAARREELVRIARNEAEHERAEHPMHRIVDIESHGDRVEVSTTDVHLPQRIGAALKRAHHGDLDIRYGMDEYSVRVHWHA